MMHDPRLALLTWLRRLQAEHRLLITALAVITLAGILGANFMLWPIEYLDFGVEPSVGNVAWVAPGGPAAQAGLQPGDRVLRMYGRPWPEVLYHWNRWTLIRLSTSSVALTVERDGRTLDFALLRRAPTKGYQVAKLVFALLGGACWVTGYMLGLVRRHEVNASWLVAAFWLLLAGVLGTYIFAIDLSLPLLVVELWLLVTLLPGLAVGIHIWFPARAVSAHRSRLARRAIVGSWAGINLLLASIWLIWRPRLVDLVAWAWLPLVVAFGVAFLASGLLLAAAYRQVGTTHVRRQIRLIASACLITAAIWIMLRLTPLLLGVSARVPDAIIDLTPILIPLAYLVSGTALNLYALDRLVMRVVAIVVTVTILVMLCGVAIARFAPVSFEAAVWAAVAAGLLFAPITRGVRRFLTRGGDLDRSYEPLRTARHSLATSLEPDILIAALQKGIQTTFHDAPFALYRASVDDSFELALIRHDRLPDLPATLPGGTLRACLRQGTPIIEALELHTALSMMTLSAAEEAAVRHQGVALWCPIWYREGELFGVVLLGTDGHLEPYRAADRREIQGLLDAAALAFANSAAYERQRAMEATLRQLFHAMRCVQDETAAELAREVHDEIINVNVQLNILALQRLLAVEIDPARHAELDLLLASEHGVSQSLRMICERLHPTGLDDQYGLAGVLRGLVDRVRVMWPGACELQICGVPCPIRPAVQRELLRIAREALANAVKHAAATTITVRLQYPGVPADALVVVIADDGQTGKSLEPKVGHWGVRNMVESARAAGGDLQFYQTPGSGTQVVLRLQVL